MRRSGRRWDQPGDRRSERAAGGDAIGDPEGNPSHQVGPIQAGPAFRRRDGIGFGGARPPVAIRSDRSGGAFSRATSAQWHRAGSNRAYRSEEHTSELQSLMRISYAVFCLKKKKIPLNTSSNV